MSLYPTNLDKWKEMTTSVDDMIAADLNDLYDACVKTETELGTNPSGDYGTLYARLFGSGNLATSNGYWQRLVWNLEAVRIGQLARGHATGWPVVWSNVPMKGPETVFGKDAPAVFAALQWPLDTYAGRPWRSWMTAFDTAKGTASFVALAGDDTDLSKTDATTCTMGFIAWNLLT